MGVGAGNGGGQRVGGRREECGTGWRRRRGDGLTVSALAEAGSWSWSRVEGGESRMVGMVKTGEVERAAGDGGTGLTGGMAVVDAGRWDDADWSEGKGGTQRFRARAACGWAAWPARPRPHSTLLD